MVLGVALVGCVAGIASAQSGIGVPCSVRIRPRAAADYDPSTEVILRGQLVGQENGMLLLRLSAGVVRVDAGTLGSRTQLVGSTVEVLASKRQEERRQWFVAREVRHGGGNVVLRDVQGVPVQL
jgi:hypothetical protein